MARLPDRFDLWIRKARESADPARQVDLVLGGLMGLGTWHLLNVGTQDDPQPAETELEGGRYLLVFSDAGRVGQMLEDRGLPAEQLPVISIPADAALGWSLERHCGLIVNQDVVIPLDHLQLYHEEWKTRGGARARGFWIPNLTSEEEDFWQEHGI